MGNLKIVDSEFLDEGLTRIADAIREKGGTGEMMAFPDGFVESISDLEIAEGEATDYLGAYLANKLTAYSNDTLQTAPDYGMSRCTSLQTVSLPALTTAGAYMFYGCVGLRSANLPALTTVSNSMFYVCSKLVTMKLNLTGKIGTNGFLSCVGMEKLDLGKPTEIGTSAFNSASALTVLILRSPTVCALNNVNAFAGTPMVSGTGYIYVPAALVEQYRGATNWSSFAEQFRAIEDYPDICGGGAE